MAKIGYLHLPTLFTSAVLIPKIVADEVLAGAGNDPARAALMAGFGTVVAPEPVPAFVAAHRLDAGEESVLANALTLLGSRAVLDDGKARAVAQALSTRCGSGIEYPHDWDIGNCHTRSCRGSHPSRKAADRGAASSGFSCGRPFVACCPGSSG